MLAASLVSTSWNDFIAESRKCMAKVEVKIVGRSHFLSGREKEIVKSLRVLSASGRRYENFTHFAQRPGYLTSEVTSFLQSHQGNWKNVKVWSEKFTSFDQVREFLSTFSESVENLDLRNISIVDTFAFTSTQNPGNAPCTRLKTLSLCNVTNGPWFLNAFGCCRHLESLEVENVDDGALILFIQSTESLKRLWISKNKWTDEFFEELSRLSFLKLEEIKLKSTHHAYPEARNGLMGFLKLLAKKGTKVTCSIGIGLKTRTLQFTQFPPTLVARKIFL